jgi:hypothetical protein
MKHNKYMHTDKTKTKTKQSKLNHLDNNENSVTAVTPIIINVSVIKKVNGKAIPVTGRGGS